MIEQLDLIPLAVQVQVDADCFCLPHPFPDSPAGVSLTYSSVISPSLPLSSFPLAPPLPFKFCCCVPISLAEASE
jgi:hypothetical protein